MVNVCLTDMGAGKKHTHKEQSEAAWGLLRRSLRELHPELPVDAEFLRDEHGKPYLPAYPEIKFNLSHSGRFAVCAVSDKSVGIDVQEWRTLKRPVESKLHPYEKDLIEGAGEEFRQQIFFDIWTRKESFIKADGRGLLIKLSDFCTVSEEELEEGKLLEAPVNVRQELNKEEFFVRQYSIMAEYSMAVCFSTGFLHASPVES